MINVPSSFVIKPYLTLLEAKYSKSPEEGSGGLDLGWLWIKNNIPFSFSAVSKNFLVKFTELDLPSDINPENVPFLFLPLQIQHLHI